MNQSPSPPQVGILAGLDATRKGIVGDWQASVVNGKLIVAGTISPRPKRSNSWRITLSRGKPVFVRGAPTICCPGHSSRAAAARSVPESKPPRVVHDIGFDGDIPPGILGTYCPDQQHYPLRAMCGLLHQWLADQVPQVVRLALLPFDRGAHEEFCRSIGWNVFREAWYPESCFEVRFERVGRRLIAVYDDDECGVGIGLYAVSSLGGIDDFTLSTLDDFDEAFRKTLAWIEPHLPSTGTIGAYHDPFGDHEYKYAYWSVSDTFVTLVQHFEGDGHAGHESSLDIRIVPRCGSAQLTFPLKTNILF